MTSARSGALALVSAMLLAGSACGGGAPTGPSTISGSTTGTAGTAGTAGVRLTDNLDGRRLLPADNWWNQDISAAPLDAQSDAYINFIGRTRQAHPDFGPPPYGIPYVGVSAA